jgi:hypothetical protein
MASWSAKKTVFAAALLPVTRLVSMLRHLSKRQFIDSLAVEFT